MQKDLNLKSHVTMDWFGHVAVGIAAVYRFCNNQATAVQVPYPRANDERKKEKDQHDREKKHRNAGILPSHLSTKMVL